MPFQLRDFTLILPWTAMTKRKAKDQETKTPTMLHLPPGVKRQLEAAAGAAGVSQSVYAMQVLQAHFKRKGIE
jgi:hypothetical protein